VDALNQRLDADPAQRDGQILLMPELVVEGWLTSLEAPLAQIVALY
jgi:hypothetical protein